MVNPLDVSTLQILEKGDLDIHGEFMWGSNYTFLTEAKLGDQQIQAVYKPTRGERPLWDFPQSTLALREVAAYLVSEALEWRLVPPTVYRKKGALGAGSLQLYIEHDPEYHYFSFSEKDRQRLRPVVLFDLLINNADRKGSHVMVDPDGHLWLIDHGVCFHVEDKLRTVIWDFAGEPIPDALCSALDRFQAKLAPVGGAESELALSLKPYLSRNEISALALRARHLMALGQYPAPNPYRRHYPWPQI